MGGAFPSTFRAAILVSGQGLTITMMDLTSQGSAWTYVHSVGDGCCIYLMALYGTQLDIARESGSWWPVTELLCFS